MSSPVKQMEPSPALAKEGSANLGSGAYGPGDDTIDPAITSIGGPVDISIARIAAALDAHVWTGPGALQDRLTLRFMLSKAEKAGRIADLNVSVREVAAWTGCWPSTASRSLRRLMTTGWITGGSNNYAGTVRVSSRGWNLVVPTEEPPVHNQESAGSPCITPFVASGLGRAAGYTYEMLTDQPISASQLAKKLEKDKRTIQRHLARLKAYGLAARDPDGWVRTDEDATRVAKDLGIEELLQRRRDRYARDSKLFQAGRPPKRITRSNGARVLVDVETGEILRE
jgi:predicted transcriptional regulator